MGEASEESGELPTPLPGSAVFKCTFWICYDHLGKLLLFNILLFLPLVLLTTLRLSGVGPGLPVSVWLPLSAAWLGAGMAALFQVLAYTLREGEMKLLQGLQPLHLAGGALIGVLCLSIGWAFSMGAILYGAGFLELPRAVGFLLSGLTAGTGLLLLHLLLWFGAGFFVHRGSLLDKLHASLLAMVLLPQAWLGIWVLTMLWAMIATLLWPLVLVWSLAPIGVLVMVGQARYRLWNPLGGAPSTAWTLHENRTMRDFWFPWKNETLRR